jgi:radical SAM-linked protein
MDEVSSDVNQRLRLTYSKGEEVKFISHQDEFRLWERTLRRAGLPLVYKGGFHPQPHMHFAAPLGVGFTGTSEFLDVVFSPALDIEEVSTRIARSLPPGVTLTGICEVSLKADSLSNSVMGADYIILFHAGESELTGEFVVSRIEEFLGKSAVWRERERKRERYSYNLRPLAFELRYEGYDAEIEEHRVFLRVQQRPGATGRPDEVVDAMGLGDLSRTLRRERLYFAHEDSDAAEFAHYGVVVQSDISRPLPDVRSGEEGPRRVDSGRSINERAGDEFE